MLRRLLLVLVSCGIASTFPGCSPDSPAGLESAGSRRVTPAAVANGKIAFMRAEAAAFNYDIWTMNADGSEMTNITDSASPDNEASPSWSPDGATIAFGLFNPATRPLAIHLIDAGGGDPAQLTDPPEFMQDLASSWSPDGTRIAFRRNDGLYVINVDGTGETLLNADGEDPAWSPNAGRIAFVIGDLFVMNADGSGVTAVTAGVEASSPTWSPDGDRIAFVIRGFIWAVDTDGSNLTQLTADTVGVEDGAFGGDSRPAWSPDGAKIAFERNDDIALMDADGTDIVFLTNDGSSPVDAWPAWPPVFVPDPDTDGDGTLDGDDNCPAIANPDQADTDGDGIGNVCDSDDDGDGILDTVDESPLVVSDRFSDIPLGGATVGRVTSVPANTAYVIEDAPNGSQGVKVTLTATGPVPTGTRFRINLDGKTSTIRLAVPGTYIVTDPDTDTTVEVTLDGPAELELSLNGTPVLISIAEGASATITETIDENGDLQDVAVTDVTGDPGGVTVNGEEVEPGADPLALASLQVKLKVTRGFLRLTGTWTPGSASAPDPDTEDVTLKVGPYTFLIPGGLTPRRGGLVFNGTLPSEPDVRLSLELRETSRAGVWSVSATGIPVGPVRNPVTVSLRVGDVIGSTITSR